MILGEMRDFAIGDEFESALKRSHGLLPVELSSARLRLRKVDRCKGKIHVSSPLKDYVMANAAEIAYQLDLTETGKGGFTGHCPCCQYETGFSVIDKDGRTLFHCHAGGCTQQEIIQTLREYGLWGNNAPQSNGLPVPHPAPSRKVSTIEAARGMWERAQRPEGTVVEAYLRARGYEGAIPISFVM
jgi:hypothetical protein